MKKLISLLIILSALLTLVSCGGYDPVPSTEEESRTVMTLSIDGKSYEIKYELYRAMFLTYKNSVDGGDASVWSGTDREKYIAEVHELITRRVTDIYAALHHADTIGINPYSDKVNKEISEYVKTSVEGGVFAGETLLGYESYDAYLQALAELGMNYSVQELIFRYAIIIDLITEHYVGVIKDDKLDSTPTGGALEYTREEVEEFYYSDDAVRYMSAFVQSQYEGAYDRAAALRERMLAKEGDDNAVAIEIISNSISAASDVMNGTLIGRYSLDEENYGDITSAAFSTAVGRVSEIVEITVGDEIGYFILYPIDKTAEHFDECYAEIAEAYVEHEIGRLLFDTQSALIESAVATDVLKGLDYSSISYPTVNLD